MREKRTLYVRYTNIVETTIFTIFVVIKCMYDKRKRNITHAPLLFVEATHNKQAVYSLNKLKNKQLKQLLDLKRA